MEALLTREDVAEALAVSLRTVDYLRSSGKLSAVHIQRSVRFLPDEVRKFVAENTTRSGLGIL
ncbi:Helix-turn-helix domain protein [Caulifigura coniformis]|uniref:Helix-turn-helix domain protein n=2 Tax=Caulifigura coniformis TaxID=2527983 RepID=A0A517SF75_9PLAN|nr:Helix-turn-helix domain protein [Caulifigura coniformis]